jgi:lipopolysaccharide/colanic/teichoic acid biosynthesis glycosyltransferase
VGKWGKEFNFPKFRSMVVKADHLQENLIISTQHQAKGKSFKMKHDPRVTPIGHLLRKTSLDELPQLWCVLKGEMSLVGPRPPLPKEVTLYSLEERKRLDVTPGLTCIWQVSGRSEIPFKEQVQLDLNYIESQSLWLDIKLLLKTIPAVLFGKGAY